MGATHIFRHAAACCACILSLFSAPHAANSQTNQSSPGYIGIMAEDVSAQTALALGLSPQTATKYGALITVVRPGSPAFSAGLKPGDLITMINGSPVENLENLRNDIEAATPGQSVSVTYARVGQLHKTKLSVATSPVLDCESAIGTPQEGKLCSNPQFSLGIYKSAVWSSPLATSCSAASDQNSCLKAAMITSGASPEAIAFASAFDFGGYLEKVSGEGPVRQGTMVMAFAANNNEQPIILANDPPMIDVWGDSRANQILSSQKSNFPGADFATNVPEFEYGRENPQGYIAMFYKYLATTCHVCDPSGYVSIAFIFTPTGSFYDVQLAGVHKN